VTAADATVSGNTSPHISSPTRFGPTIGHHCRTHRCAPPTRLTAGRPARRAATPQVAPDHPHHLAPPNTFHAATHVPGGWRSPARSRAPHVYLTAVATDALLIPDGERMAPVTDWLTYLERSNRYLDTLDGDTRVVAVQV